MFLCLLKQVICLINEGRKYEQEQTAQPRCLVKGLRACIGKQSDPIVRSLVTAA